MPRSDHRESEPTTHRAAAARPATFGNSRLADMRAAEISCNAVGHRARRRQPAAMCCLVRRRRPRGWSVDANGKLTAIGINAAAEEAVHGHHASTTNDPLLRTIAIGINVETAIF